MKNIEYSPGFIKNINDIFGQSGKIWLQTLPDLVEQLTSRWHIQFLSALPNLSYSFVCMVKMEDGETAILKLSPDLPRLKTEATWLRHMPRGVPMVYQFEENHGALLMEHIKPGRSLKDHVLAGKDDEASSIICRLVLTLQQENQPESTLAFKHLSELQSDLEALNHIYDARLLSKAKSLFHDLTIDKTKDILLHGDLHHDNILSCGTEWKAIDPHGYIGDPVSEVGAMIRNMWDYYHSEMEISRVVERRLKIMIDQLPFDAERIKAWAFCMTVLSAAWTVRDHADAKRTDLDIEIAEVINRTKVGPG